MVAIRDIGNAVSKIFLTPNLIGKDVYVVSD
jgi:hypothetical protein